MHFSRNLARKERNWEFFSKNVHSSYKKNLRHGDNLILRRTLSVVMSIADHFVPVSSFSGCKVGSSCGSSRRQQ